MQEEESILVTHLDDDPIHTIIKKERKDPEKNYDFNLIIIFGPIESELAKTIENRAKKGHKWRTCTKWTRRYIPRQELYSHLDYLLLQNVLANSGMRF